MIQNDKQNENKMKDILRNDNLCYDIIRMTILYHSGTTFLGMTIIRMTIIRMKIIRMTILYHSISDISQLYLRMTHGRMTLSRMKHIIMTLITMGFVR